MTAPEREALVKALEKARRRLQSARDDFDEDCGEGDCEDCMALRKIKNEISEIDAALSIAPAVTVTEDARNGDYSDDISPEAFETLRKSVEGVNSSRLDRAAETLNNYTVSDRFPSSDRDAVLEEAADAIDRLASCFDSSISYKEKGTAVACAKIVRACKSTTPQTGSQE